LVEVTGTYHHAWLIGCDGVSLSFCPGWSQTKILLISASQAAGNIDVSHHAPFQSQILLKREPVFSMWMQLLKEKMVFGT
jgi:hypothetical protein